MITFLILIILVIVCYHLIDKAVYTKFEWLNWIILITSSFYLFIHSIFYPLSSFDYEMLEANRNSIQKSLNDSRILGNKYESATVLRDVLDFNIRLAERKYMNKTLFFDQYIDDRIDSLKPIK